MVTAVIVDTVVWHYWISVILFNSDSETIKENALNFANIFNSLFKGILTVQLPIFQNWYIFGSIFVIALTAWTLLSKRVSRTDEDIKLFTDNLATFGNMFFVFAESDSVDNESESSDDPAFKSRKANLTYQIADISSETEVEKLFRMILKRYEKYYEVSFEAYTDDILQMIYDDPLIREKTNYRGYTQAIMRVLDQFRNKPPKAKRVRRNKVSDNENGKIDEGELYNIEKEKYDKWKKATSISKKTMLCEMLEKMIATSKESIVSKSKKKGEYVTRKNQCLKRYYIISTDNPSKKDFEKRVVNLQDFIFSEEEKIYVLYPASEEDIDDNSNIKTILYNDSTVENSFKIMYGDEIEECDMDVYLSTLDIRRSNAKD